LIELASFPSRVFFLPTKRCNVNYTADSFFFVVYKIAVSSTPQNCWVTVHVKLNSVGSSIRDTGLPGPTFTSTLKRPTMTFWPNYYFLAKSFKKGQMATQTRLIESFPQPLSCSFVTFSHPICCYIIYYPLFRSGTNTKNDHKSVCLCVCVSVCV